MIEFTEIKIALGEEIETNDDISKSIGWSAEDIFNKTGIKQRYIAGPSQTAESLAFQAVQNITSAKLKDIDLIVSVSNTQSIDFPNISNYVHTLLGLPDSVQCYGINHGCSGYVDGIKLIYSFFCSGFSQKALLVTSDTYSKFINKDDRSIRTIFSDGASATIISKNEVSGWKLRNEVSNSQIGSQSFLERQTKDGISEISMNGPQVLLFSINTVAKNLLRICPIEEEFILFPHQAGKIVIETLKKKLPKNVTVLENYQNYGNLVSTSIPNLMKDYLPFDSTQNTILISGFGVGLSHSSILLSKKS